jgi:hypothetical protein
VAGSGGVSLVSMAERTLGKAGVRVAVGEFKLGRELLANLWLVKHWPGALSHGSSHFNDAFVFRKRRSVLDRRATAGQLNVRESETLA